MVAMSERFSRIRAFICRKPVTDLLIALGVSFFVCLCASTGLSPIYVGNSASDVNIDCDFFRYIASLWIAGKKPYLDFFDNKGLYHLAINVIGLKIGGRYGIWFLEILFAFGSLYPLTFLIRHLFGDERRYRVLLYLFFFLGEAFVLSGNFEGEWILPFTSAFVCNYVEGITSGKSKPFYLGSFFMGLSVGLALNSRPIDGLFAAFGASFCVIYAIRHHEGLFLLYNGLIAIAGCLLPCVIFFPIAYYGGYFKEMIQAIFIQSFSYAGHNARETDVLTITYKAIAVILILIHVAFFTQQRKAKVEPFELSLFFFYIGFASDILIALLMGYGHYLQAGVGYWSVAMIYGLDELFKAKTFPWKKWGIGILSGALTLYLGVFFVGYYAGNLPVPFSYEDTMDVAKDVALIKAEVGDKEGAVYALDCDPSVYLDGSFIVKQRFLAYQHTMIKDNPSAKDEISAYLTSADKPIWLLVKPSSPCLATFNSEISASYHVVSTISNSAFTAYTLNS